MRFNQSPWEVVCLVNFFKSSINVLNLMLGGLFHFQLQFAAGRDLMHGQVGSMIDTLGIWLAYIPFFQKKCLTSSILQHISHSKSLVEAYLVVVVSAFLRRIPG